MMKISKPFTLDHFPTSHVQFTSLNSIVFSNVKAVYFGNEKISLEYEYQSTLKLSSRDWIGIFPRGWSSLQQYVTFEWVSQGFQRNSSDRFSSNMENEEEIVRKTIIFLPKYHGHAVHRHTTYQFVYVSKQIEVLGVSGYFRFDVSKIDSPELESLVPVASSLVTSSSEHGNITLHSVGSLTLDPTPAHSHQSLISEGKSKNCQGKTISPCFSQSEPLFQMSTPLQCKKCFQFRRNNYALRSQEMLQSKLKVVMERNKVLEQRVQEMKKENERYQLENKKIRMTFYTLNKEKVAYEKFVKDFIKSLEKDSIVRVMNGTSEILVKKINYVGMEDYHRDKKTSKRERELKAVIGLQEITIRNLISSLQTKAKTAEEINDTVKFATEFADVSKEEESECSNNAEDMMEINSDVNSEYDFVLKKPEPPEGIAPTADTVLEDIKKTTEMELRDIGIDRKLVDITPESSKSDLNMPQLQVENEFSPIGKKVHSIGTTKEFRSMENNHTWTSKHTMNKSREAFKNVRRKVSQITLDESFGEISSRKEILKPTNEEDKNKYHRSSKDEREIKMEEKEEDYKRDIAIEGKKYCNMQDDASCFTEDFFDACDVSPRSSHVEAVNSRCDVLKENCGKLVRSKSEEEISKGNEIVLQNHESENKTEKWVNSVTERNQYVKEFSPKGKTFTCELIIDLNPGRIASMDNPNIDQVINRDCKKNDNIVAVPSDNIQTSVSNDTQKIFTLKRGKSLIIFKQTEKRLDIKITKVSSDEHLKSKENQFQQKMSFKFGARVEDGTCDNSKGPKLDINLDLNQGKSNVLNEINGKLTESPSQIESGDKSALLENMGLMNEEEEEEDVLTPRSAWKDAEEEVDSSKASSSSENSDGGENVANKADEIEKKVPEKEPIKEIQMKKVRFEEKNCRYDMLNDDSVNNLKIYQESLRYEKNLEYFQNKENFESSKKSGFEGSLVELCLQNG